MGSRLLCLLGRELINLWTSSKLAGQNCTNSEMELEDMNFGNGAPSVNAQMSLSILFKYAEYASAVGAAERPVTQPGLVASPTSFHRLAGMCSEQ